ncbi:glucosamine-6-phosphate deaminase [Bacillus sp. 1P10SD]|uniref:glucosamine-6-phosphate deaminase n=1 Tax=Bacillus sp. 1P10SD TaxID=3132265 RepID=UPI0039A44D52
MNVHVYDTYEEMSKNAAEEIISLLNSKPNSVLCIPGGDTPKEMLSYLVQAYKLGRVDFSQATFIGLDDWVGVGPEDIGSCQLFLNSNFFHQVNAKKENIHLFDTMSEDLENECKKKDELVEKYGGFDLMILGIGMNGHLGFNEPGVDFGLKSHVIDLDETTQSVGQKYFEEKKELKQGITLGVKHLLNSRTIFLLANGEKKAEIVKATIEGPVTNTNPASVLQQHENIHYYLDQKAASLLG